MHGEEAERAVEVDAGVGDVVARFGWCTARYREEGGDGGGFESLGEESGQHLLGAGGNGELDRAQPRQVRCCGVGQKAKPIRLRVSVQVSPPCAVNRLERPNVVGGGCVQQGRRYYPSSSRRQTSGLAARCPSSFAIAAIRERAIRARIRVGPAELLVCTALRHNVSRPLRRVRRVRRVALRPAA